MEQLTFFQKLKILVDTVFSSTFFFIVLILALAITFAMIKVNKENKKTKNKVFIIVYSIIIGFVVIMYGSSILKMIDNLVDNIFTNIYFPNLATYIVMLFTTNVINIISFFSKRVTNLIKIINTICFVFIQFLFIMILDIIIKNNIDIYSKLEVYSNTKLLAIIELSMIIFALWLITLVVINIIYKLQNKVELSDRQKPKNAKIDDKNTIKSVETTIPYNKSKVNNYFPNNHVNQNTFASNKKGFNNNLNMSKQLSKNNFMNSLNEQFEQTTSNDNLEIKQVTLAELLDKKDLTISDYRRLKEILDNARSTNNLSNDELEKIITRLKNQ